MRIPEHIHKKIADRKADNAFRTLKNNLFTIDFFSNDYIGFASSKAIHAEVEKILAEQKWQHGATGSRLLSGNHSLYEVAENEITKFHNSESALLFNSGYDANVGFFSCIPQRNDIMLYDSYIHASIRDGISLGLTKSYKFKHNDLSDLEKLLKKFSSSKQTTFVATESVFSMDGDSPDLLKMTELCEQYGAFLIVDEAHALGVFGQFGCGLVQHLGLENRVFARIVTYGKALGCHGAAILSSGVVKDYLINFARSLIYTTAMPPQSVAHIVAGYRQLKKTTHIKKLQENISLFKNTLEKHKKNYSFIHSNSSIQAMIVSGNDFVKSVAEQLQNKGFGVMPILSPTIPKGEERLRICLHSFNTEEQILNLVNNILYLNESC
ncbi:MULTISPECIES: aminotransferase class I/II-fold pyridoxal phosphate-dependent enzyme [Capnocytophaga]|uniref:aminotransferase class I/II-fold pyridoxal phosphate-dependent enzyme n=1 Tax=Capnocytophaga TaxID=1016 RepID=UPI000BB1745D|nr:MULTISPECIES: pyridoxal phosphate-dependent aminotransferase family protein [Capnocytophaga]ATA72810.1 8-amino-7-oxononanoate synthase [Capnocytophaga sp. H4358]